MNKLQHISEMPWYRRWWHRIYCFFALRQTRRLLRQRRCTHRNVTVTEDGGRCNSCGVDLEYNASTRNWVAGVRSWPGE